MPKPTDNLHYLGSLGEPGCTEGQCRKEPWQRHHRCVLSISNPELLRSPGVQVTQDRRPLTEGSGGAPGGNQSTAHPQSTCPSCASTPPHGSPEKLSPTSKDTGGPEVMLPI